MANYMEQVAKLLGVELNEKFLLYDEYGESLGYTYKIIPSGLYFESRIQEQWLDSNELEEILVGIYNIVKLTFIPKEKEMYWTYDSLRQEFFPYKTMWMNTVQDYARLKCNMVFRTEAEAIDARPRIYKELTGKEWGVDD